MAEGSLLAHLAPRFVPQTENLATESLCYILQRSSVARKAFLEMLGQAGAGLPADLRFRTQATGVDGAIPDVAGVDQEGHGRVLIEAKFWASLTNNQPVSYLGHLEYGGLLLFIAPSLRLETLWAQLLRRCREAGLAPTQTLSEEAVLRATRIGSSDRIMALASWHTILTPIARALAAAREVQLAEDLTQLQGLCERMDTEGFLPLSSEEMTTVSPRRLLQYAPLINDLVSRLLQFGCDVKGLNAFATALSFGRYFRLTEKKMQLCVAVDYRKWATLASTPLWLRFWAPKGTSLGVVRNLLGSLEHETPTRLFADPDDSTQLCMPLFAPLGEEREIVLESLVRQLLEPLGLLAHLQTISGIPPAAMNMLEEPASPSLDDIDTVIEPANAARLES